MDLYCQEVSRKTNRLVMGVMMSERSWVLLAVQDTSFSDCAVRFESTNRHVMRVGERTRQTGGKGLKSWRGFC